MASTPLNRNMSWITDLAGKAEEFLNKIDSNAATVLKTNKKAQQRAPSSPSQLQPTSFVESGVPPQLPSPSPRLNTPVVDSPSGSSTPASVPETEQLIEYLNGSTTLNIEPLLVPNDAPSLPNGHAHSTPDHVALDPPTLNENEMLKNELRSVNNEMTLLLSRTKNAEKDILELKNRLWNKERHATSLENDLTNLKGQLEESELKCSDLHSENERLKEVADSNLTAALTETKSQLSKVQLESQKREEKLKLELNTLKMRLTEAEQSLFRLKGENTAEVTEANERLKEAREELEMYRIKAQRTLQEKEKLILELRKQSSGTATLESVNELELQQLNDGKAALISEIEELQTKLAATRDQLMESDKKLENLREEFSEALRSTQAKLSEETSRRVVAEEHCNSHTEELHSVREELSRQVTVLAERVRERDSELTKLRRQISQRPSLPKVTPEAETRISELSRALTEKQLLLQQITKERNDLKFQLETNARKYDAYSSPLLHGRLNVNDTDDAKAQTPSLLSESPFDSGVARRVKRAYSSLDRVSIQLGVFLRRYPLARILVVCYMMFLHLWVCLVLFSSTPDTK